MTRLRSVTAFALLLALAAGSQGVSASARAAPAPSALSADDKALVDAAAASIQALASVEGRFTQIDPRGVVSTGTVYLSRPGRARFQYDPPSELLVVADGDMVSVYDRKLKSFDQYPLEQTPLNLILGKTVRWEGAIQVESVKRAPGGFVIEAKDPRGQTPGRLFLTFSDHPLALRGWTVVDAQGQKTQVRLGPLKPAHPPSSLFVLNDPNAGAERH